MMCSVEGSLAYHERKNAQLEKSYPSVFRRTKNVNEPTNIVPLTDQSYRVGDEENGLDGCPALRYKRLVEIIRVF